MAPHFCPHPYASISPARLRRARQRHLRHTSGRINHFPRSSNKSAWRAPQARRRFVDIPVCPLRPFGAGAALLLASAPLIPGAGPELLPAVATAARRRFLTIFYVGHPAVRAFHHGQFFVGCALSPLNQSPISATPTAYVRWLREATRALHYFLFLKLKYKGKSYKWFRRGNSLVLRFGHSHAVRVSIPRFCRSRRVGKMKMLFFGTSLVELRALLSRAIQWKPMNIYNGRGLRFAKQLVFRKFGKVSAYR